MGGRRLTLLPPLNASFSIPTPCFPISVQCCDLCFRHAVTRGSRTYSFPSATPSIVLVIRIHVFRRSIVVQVSVYLETREDIDAEMTREESRASRPRRGHVTFLLDSCGVANLALAASATVIRETRV